MKLIRLHAWNFNKEIINSSNEICVVLACAKRNGIILGEELIDDYKNIADSLELKSKDFFSFSVIMENDHPSYFYQNGYTDFPLILIYKKGKLVEKLSASAKTIEEFFTKKYI